MDTALVPQTGVAAGVPYVAVPPLTPSPSSPVVVAWHMLDAPRSEPAFAAALPLAGLDAWRMYLGLPMSGSRLPAGGLEELMRLGSEDAVRTLNGPIIEQAAEEFEAAWPALRETLRLGEGPVGVLGGSGGAAVAQLVLAEGGLRATAAVLVSPLVQLRAAVDAIGRQFGVSYPWSEPSLAVARQLDFVARADELAPHGKPAVLLVVGEQDDEEGFRQPAARLRDALGARTEVDMVVVPGMVHALAEEPGMEPAPQTPHAAEIDRLAVDWLRRHLS